MVIDTQQLDRWCNQGAQQTAINTHLSVRSAINSDTARFTGKNIEVFLQGSYKNDTNIRGDSDVDIDICLKDTFFYNIDALSPEEQALFHRAYPTTTQYTLDIFRNDVLTTLRNYYGVSTVTEGNKVLKIEARSNTLNADVIVCCPHYKFQRFRAPTDANYIEGIAFWTIRDRSLIVSYPKLHTEKLQEKNQATEMHFKPTVRMFKNARTYLEEKSAISPSLAPSYFLESLIYNVPNDRFTTDVQQNFYQVLDWLNHATLEGMVCPNGITQLFGGSNGSWFVDSARLLINRLIYLWNNGVS